MTITVSLIQVTGPAGSAGTVIDSQALAAPSTWTRITTAGTIPSGGAIVQAVSDAEAFRIAIIDPKSSQDAGAADTPPPHNGILVTGVTYPLTIEDVPPGSQVWVKQA